MYLDSPQKCVGVGAQNWVSVPRVLLPRGPLLGAFRCYLGINSKELQGRGANRSILDKRYWCPSDLLSH